MVDCFPICTSLARDLYFLQNAEGSGLAPFDCWICLRGIKTMALRVEKQQVLIQIRSAYYFFQFLYVITFKLLACCIYPIFAQSILM